MPRTLFLSKSRRVRVLGTVVLALIAVTAIRLWHSQTPVASKVSALPAIPVDTALVARTDVPIYLEGLGTVQAFNTVTVTTRVDGQLQTVNFVEGQDVLVGDVLAQIDPRPYQATLDQAVATKAKDEALLANAKIDLQRYISLAPQNYTSKQTLDTQRALVAQLDAQVKMDQASIDSAKTNLDYTTIRSPINGRTGIRQVDAGNNLLASANKPIVMVTQVKPISVVFSLAEEHVQAVANGMAEGPLTAIAFSRDNKTELDRGQVTVLDNEINQPTGSVRLKAIFQNSKEKLWPGDFVNVKLLVRTEKDALTVSSAAVQRGPDSLFVYIVKPDSTLEVRPISLAAFDSGTARIKSGLNPGETVVTAGQYRLQAGAHVLPSSGAELARSQPNPSGDQGQPQ